MKILLLGAGMAAKPLANYILENNIQLTIASRTVSKADVLIAGNKHGKALKWDIEDLHILEELVQTHDLTISILPSSHQVTVAKLCIKHKRNMVTTSYLSDEMKELDTEAKAAGIIIMNEIGFNPGIDQMAAMQIIEKIHDKGGKIKEFYSLCGTLAASGEADNPFNNGFVKSSKGELLAENSGAKYLKEGKIIEIPSKNTLESPLIIDFPGIGEMEAYPNLDSTTDINLYGLKDVTSIYCGTLRHPKWCEIIDAIKRLGLVSYKKQNFSGKTYKRIIAQLLDVYPANIKEKVAERLGLSIDSPAVLAMEWLGLFRDDFVTMNEGSNFDLVADLMLKKLTVPRGGRDMAAMLHSFVIENADGTTEVLKSHLLDFGTKEFTSIARTVGLPAAIASKMILDGKITEKGVHIPISKNIYEPVLSELEKYGIALKEERNVIDSHQIIV